MAIDYRIIWFLLFSCFFGVYEASDGESDASYRACVEHCQETGCIGERCFSHCNLSSESSSINGPWYMQKPFYLQLNQWYCQSDCQFHCMADQEKERTDLGLGPVKYDGKWLLQKFYCFQEPVSVAFTALNLALNFCGWRSFLFHVYYKLPPAPDRRPYYDYTGLWTIYAILSMNSCLWSAVYHSRDMYLTKLLDCYSWVALLGYSIILALIRAFGLRDDPSRVMVAAPMIAFTTAHIFYLNNYQTSFEWNAKVCIVLAMAQLLTWSIWATVSQHPSQMKLRMAIAVGSLKLYLETLDFPPYKGLVDARTLWHAAAIPLTCIWWSFAKDDANYRTSILVKKVK